MDSKSYYNWLQDGECRGWKMHSAPWWKRLPVIRHVRAFLLSIGLDRHNDFWRAAGRFPTGEDEWRLWGIYHGLEREAE